MTSQINPNLINGAYPVAGQDNSTKGMRDNFTNIKTNFNYAASEISALQATVVTSGSGTENDLAGALIYNAEVQNISAPAVNWGNQSGTVQINWAAGLYQTIIATGSVVLNFVTNSYPTAGVYGQVKIKVTINNVAHTLRFPSQVTVNNQGIQGLDTSTNTITFAATGVYEFLFETSDNGATFIVAEVNKRMQPFNNSSENLAASGAANLAVTTSYFSTVVPTTATLAAGVNGQVKVFALYADIGDSSLDNMVITVTNAGWKTSGTGTITFDTIGDACTLQYINAKWFCIGNNGCVFA
jgi:hypothetical protein